MRKDKYTKSYKNKHKTGRPVYEKENVTGAYSHGKCYYETLLTQPLPDTDRDSKPKRY